MLDTSASPLGGGVALHYSYMQPGYSSVVREIRVYWLPTFLFCSIAVSVVGFRMPFLFG